MQLISILALIHFLSPGVNGHELAESIVQNCRTDVQELAVLIAFQESSFTFNECNGHGDCGIFQINSIHGYKVKTRLDLDKSTKIACTMLVVLKEKYSASDAMWFARFHSSTPHLKKRYYKAIWNHYAKGNYEK